MTTTPAMPEPFAWAWRNKVTGAKGIYFEDPKPFGITSHPDYKWTNLYTEAQPLTTQQAQPAEVSDAEIDAAWVKNGGGLNSNNYRAFARAILALRPQAVPMTDEQRQQAFNKSWATSSDFFAGIEAAEAHYGIAAPAGGEG